MGSCELVSAVVAACAVVAALGVEVLGVGECSVIVMFFEFLGLIGVYCFRRSVCRASACDLVVWSRVVCCEVWLWLWLVSICWVSLR